MVKTYLMRVKHVEVRFVHETLESSPQQVNLLPRSFVEQVPHQALHYNIIIILIIIINNTIIINTGAIVIVVFYLNN